MKVLLIQPPTNKWYRDLVAHQNSLPPLGILYIASFLKLKGHKIQLIDFLVETFSKSVFKGKIKKFCPDVVGVSLYPEGYSFGLEIAGVIKQILPMAKIVFGGPLATLIPQEVLQNPNVDFVVMREGEFTMLELLEYLDNPKKISLKNIKGLAYKVNGKIFINPMREFISDLDSLPIPDRSILRNELYTYPFTLIASRGCPGRCIFCAAAALSGSTYRMRSAENVFAEICSLMKDYNMRAFYIADDTFTVSRKRVFKLCSLLKKAPIKLSWACESRADTLTREMMETMHGAGCYRMQIGVESGVQKILNKIKKGISLEKIEKIAKWGKDLGIQIHCSFILGHAMDTIETMEETIKFAKMLKEIYGCKIFPANNTPFPGTYQYKHAKRLGLIIHVDSWDDYILENPTISTKNFSREDLRKKYYEFTELNE